MSAPSLLAMMAILGTTAAIAGFALLITRDRQSAKASRPRANLEQAETFPLPGIREEYRLRSRASDAMSRQVETEFRRWFALAAASPLPLGMCSEQVDEFWHILLEKPSLYRAWCEAVAGRYIDHREGVGGADLTARTHVAYREVYGTSPPPRIWNPARPSEVANVRATSERRRDDNSSSSSDSTFLMMTMHCSGSTHGGGSHGGDGGSSCSSCGGGGGE